MARRDIAFHYRASLTDIVLAEKDLTGRLGPITAGRHVPGHHRGHEELNEQITGGWSPVGTESWVSAAKAVWKASRPEEVEWVGRRRTRGRQCQN